MVGEVYDGLLKTSSGSHLAMRSHCPCAGHKPSYLVFKLREVLDAVGDKEHLSVAAQFEIDGLCHYFVESNVLTLVTMGWRLAGGVLSESEGRAPMSENWRVRGMGVRAHRERVDVVHFHLLQFLFDRTPNFCSSSTMSSPRSLNFTVFADKLVCADKYIDFADLEIGECLPHLFGLSGAGKGNPHAHRQVL